jgi:hypothetical protein
VGFDATLGLIAANDPPLINDTNFGACQAGDNDIDVPHPMVWGSSPVQHWA